MRQLLLASALIALPVAGFSAFELLLPGAPPATAGAVTDSLGDLSVYETIVADTQDLAKQGDLTAAERRATDFETQWDEDESSLRPKAPEAWGNVDAAADDAFAALRAAKPDQTAVEQSLAALSLALVDPAGGGGPAGTAALVNGIAVTDANGHPLPCESLLTHLRVALSDGPINASARPAATALQAKALERCNADDDVRANAFSAQALALAHN